MSLSETAWSMLPNVNPNALLMNTVQRTIAVIIDTWGHEPNVDKELVHIQMYLAKRNYSAIALPLNPRLKYTAKRPTKRQNKVSLFLAYMRYFSYLYTYERASYGYIKRAHPTNPVE